MGLNESGEEQAQSISVWKMTVVAFLLTSGGPFGVESSVSAAGPLVALLIFASFPLLFCLPQALITAELGSLCNENGGYVVWIERAFGKFAGYLNSMNRLCSNVCDLALYPVLFTDYLRLFASSSCKPSNSWLAGPYSYLLKLGMVLSVGILNVFGIKMMGWVSTLFTALILSPFFIQFAYVAADLNPSIWLESAPLGSVQWALFFSILMWNYTGGDQLGAMAEGEVKNPQRTYPAAVLLSVVLNIVSFVVPILSGLTQNDKHPWRDWHAGSFLILACNIAPWMGNLILFAALVSSLGQFNVQLSANSRVVWKIAKLGHLPSCFGNTTSYGTPIIGLLFHVVTTCVLMGFSFEIVVQLDMILNCVSLLMEVNSFLWLRYKEPNTPRPFLVPFGLIGAWAMCFIKAAVLGCVLIMAVPYVLFIGLGLNLVLIIIFYIRLRFTGNTEHPFIFDTEG